jgi:hypothetical protein
MCVRCDARRRWRAGVALAGALLPPLPEQLSIIDEPADDEFLADAR